MPFRDLVSEGRALRLAERTPRPELRQLDRRRFVVLRSFCYRAPEGDPDAGTVFVVPGEDFRVDSEERSVELGADSDGRPNVVVPADTSGRTDLASVPPVFWWLVASYGNHTRAALLHDALYVEDGEPPVPRRTADRLFLSALRERGPVKAGPFRHWLMWAAVSAFGTMRYRLGLLFAFHVLAVWALTITGIAWAWGDRILWFRWEPWQVVVAVLAALVFLVVLGSSWRAGVDLKGGWLFPALLTSAVVVVPLLSEWTSPFRLEWPFALLAAALVLVLLGPLWGFCVDPTLRGWLWPTALIGLPLALVPSLLVLVALVLVWLIDLGAALGGMARKDRTGEPRGFEWPELEQARVGL